MFSLRPLRRGWIPSFTGDLFSNFWDWPSDMGFKVDIKEEEQNYLLLAEMPGVNKENINLEITGEYLVISAKSDESHNQEDNRYIRKERRMMSYQRQFYVGDIDPEEVQAKYENGILEIKIPKQTQEKPDRRNIDIH